MDIASANDAASAAFIAALAANGITDACVTPGSRSTPLTVALARQQAVRPWLHLDERSAAFFALGLARQTGRPAVLVCTSGTAAANYYPAVVEANLSRVPLIVCTADRPPRLRGVGADQTIDQVGMFGPNARWEADLPVPLGLPSETTQVRTFATRAVKAALSPLPGPVHINFPFEEPLLSAPGKGVAALTSRAAAIANAPALGPSADEIAIAAAKIAASRRPLVVAAPETGGLPAAELAALAAAIDAPILADPLSGLRTGTHDRSRVLDSYDAILRDPRCDGYAPDCVIRFGSVPTSKALNLFLARTPGLEQVLCEQPGGWRDPWALTTAPVIGDPGPVAEALRAAVGAHRSEGGWTEGWLARDRLSREAMRASAAGFEAPFEGRVFTELQALLDADTTVVVGNSMPVRDLDSFLASGAKPLHFASNRGANGIDGVTSSALGAAAGAQGRVVLVIGDISFYHDLNGLWASMRHKLNLTVVLVNNNGGGIFHFLPQVAHEDVFEEWFGTPDNLDFAPAVAMYGGRFVSTTDWDVFRREVASSRGGLNVVEVRTDRVANVTMHQQAWMAAARAAWEAVPV